MPTRKNGIRMICSYRRCWAFVVAMLFCNPLPPVSGQVFFQDQVQDTSALIEPPREIERLLREATREIEKKNWSVATKALGLVLGLEAESVNLEGNGQDFFLQASEGGLRKTAHQQAYELFNSIPEEGQATIELRYGIDAQKSFDSAAANDDWRAIDALAGKYLMTDYGRQAAYLAAEHQIALGNPAWAASRWETLMSWKMARKQFGPTLGAAAAAAWKAAGQELLAKETLTRTFSLYGLKEFQVANAQLSADNIDDAYNRLDISTIVRRSEKQSSPRVPGGEPDRNADTLAGLPLPFVSWHSLLHESSRHEDRAIQTIALQSNKSDQASLVPSRTAVVIPPYLVCMTYDQRIHAINLQTGVLEGVSAFAGMPHYIGQDYIESEDSRLPLQDELVQRIWGQQATGQLSADDANIYAVVEQPSIDTAESLQRGVNAMIATRVPRQNYNVLQAYSIDKQVSLAWEVGGENGLREPALSNVLFLGPPLPFNDELYAIGELNGELLLFALNPQDGKLLWRQQLAANNAFTIASDSIRRNFSSTPSFHAGVLICPTLSNELVAVELVSRSLLWSQSYDRSRETAISNRPNMWGTPQGGTFKPLEFRSSETSAVIENGVAIYAPPDGSGVFAVDVFSGKLLWNGTDKRVQYVGAIVDDVVILSHGSSLTGVELRTGKQVWIADLKAYGAVAGRLARNGKDLLVPVTSKQIVQVDASTGKIISEMQVEKAVGNLIATKDSLISVSPVSVTCYPIRDQVKLRLQNDLAGQADSPLVMARKAEIALSESDLKSAFDLALKAYNTQPRIQMSDH